MLSKGELEFVEGKAHSCALEPLKNSRMQDLQQMGLLKLQDFSEHLPDNPTDLLKPNQSRHLSFIDAEGPAIIGTAPHIQPVIQKIGQKAESRKHQVQRTN